MTGQAAANRGDGSDLGSQTITGPTAGRSASISTPSASIACERPLDDIGRRWKGAPTRSTRSKTGRAGPSLGLKTQMMLARKPGDATGPHHPGWGKMWPKGVSRDSCGKSLWAPSRPQTETCLPRGFMQDRADKGTVRPARRGKMACEEECVQLFGALLRFGRRRAGHGDASLLIGNHTGEGARWLTPCRPVFGPFRAMEYQDLLPGPDRVRTHRRSTLVRVLSPSPVFCSAPPCGAPSTKPSRYSTLSGCRRTCA